LFYKFMWLSLCAAGFDIPHEEFAHISPVDHPVSQASLEISPIWTPIIAAEVRKLQLLPVQIMCENCVLCWYHTENLSL
jgi:hypothetical protein